MWKILRFAAVALTCTLLVSCGEDGLSPARDTPRSLTPAERELVGSYNAFGLRLFREIVKGSGDKNVFISPASVSMALGMTVNGAAGTTEEAMKSTLEFSGMTTAEIDECYRSLIELLVGLDPKVQFQIANSIWYRLGWTFEQPFLDACRTYFNAEVSGLDFSSPEAAAVINAWVSQSTNGRIQEIVNNPIDIYTVMFLVNAIYFKGTWTHRFDPSLTKDDQFTLPDGSTAPCKMMQQPEPGKTGDFSYYANDTFQVLDLPYADGWFSMTILLPAPSVKLDSIIAELDHETWKQWTAGLGARTGRIEVPRFELQYEATLNDVLGAMGMEPAFDPYTADFTRMYGDGGLFISRVKHKTFVKVDEEGTEAAAVTSVEVGTTSAPDDFEMRVDRPFLFAIRENHSGTVLFIGKIVDPA
jgi:serine protease inhibitor